jgi:hypothetical protein
LNANRRTQLFWNYPEIQKRCLNDQSPMDPIRTRLVRLRMAKLTREKNQGAYPEEDVG